MLYSSKRNLRIGQRLLMVKQRNHTTKGRQQGKQEYVCPMITVLPLSGEDFMAASAPFSDKASDAKRGLRGRVDQPQAGRKGSSQAIDSFDSKPNHDWVAVIEEEEEEGDSFDF